jgi:Fibronectin type III domain
VTEAATSGWTTSYQGCSNVVLVATQTTVPTCTITNTKQAAPPPAPAQAKLLVKKVVVGATTSPSAFSFTVSNGGGTYAFEADGDNLLTLPEGTYSVTEAATSGWTTSYQGCSNVVLVATQTTVPTCTITNTKQAAPPPLPPSPADITPPSAPDELVVTATTPHSIKLSWAPSTDDIGVAGYGVYWNGSRVDTVVQPRVTLDGLDCGTSYALAVDAVDAAGNHSSQATAVAPSGSCHASADSGNPSQPGNDNSGKPGNDNSGKPGSGDDSTSAFRLSPGIVLPRWTLLVPLTPVLAPTSSDDGPGLWDPWLCTIGPCWSPLAWLARSVEVTTAAPARDAGASTSVVVRPTAVWTQVVGPAPMWLATPEPSPVTWDGRRFTSLDALRIHLQWSGVDYARWKRLHPGAVARLTA